MIPVQRLFVGIELPPECKETLRDLDPHLQKVRWLPPSQMHLTLSFLGSVPIAMQGVLSEELGKVRTPPFFLPLQGVGFFQKGGRPSVIWVGTGRGHPHLFALHKHIQDAVLRAHLEPDLKPFRPHVTVARAGGISLQALLPFARKHRETDFGLFKVDAFALFSSVLSSGGAIHRKEFEVAL